MKVRTLLALALLAVAACGDGGTDPVDPCEPACPINVEGIYEAVRTSADTVWTVRLYDEDPDSTMPERYYMKRYVGEPFHVTLFWGMYTAREDSIFFTDQQSNSVKISDGTWSADGSFTADHSGLGVLRWERIDP